MDNKSAPTIKMTEFDDCIEKVKSLNSRAEFVFTRLRGASGRLLGNQPEPGGMDAKGVSPMPQGKIFEIRFGLNSLEDIIAKMESFAESLDSFI